MKNLLLAQLAGFKDDIEDHNFYKDDSSVEAAGSFWYFLTVIFQLMYEDLLKLELQEVRNAEKFIRQNFEIFIIRLSQWVKDYDLVKVVQDTDWDDEDSVYDTTWARHMYQGVFERLMVFLEDEWDLKEYAGNDKNYELLLTYTMRRTALKADSLILLDRQRVKLMQNQGFEVFEFQEEEFWWCSKSADNQPDEINGIPGGCWLPQYFQCSIVAGHLDNALDNIEKAAFERHLSECKDCAYLHKCVDDDLVEFTRNN